MGQPDSATPTPDLALGDQRQRGTRWGATRVWSSVEKGEVERGGELAGFDPAAARHRRPARRLAAAAAGGRSERRGVGAAAEIAVVPFLRQQLLRSIITFFET